jgi:hypothetical protein
LNEEPVDVKGVSTLTARTDVTTGAAEGHDTGAVPGRGSLSEEDWQSRKAYAALRMNTKRSLAETHIVIDSIIRAIICLVLWFAIYRRWRFNLVAERNEVPHSGVREKCRKFIQRMLQRRLYFCYEKS